MSNESYEDIQPEIERMMEDYLLLRRQGKAPAIEDFIKRYPAEHRQALKDRIEEYEQLHLVFSAIQQYQAEKIAAELSDERLVNKAYRQFQQKVAAQTQALSWFSRRRVAWGSPFPSRLHLVAAASSVALILIIGFFLFTNLNPPALELHAQLVRPTTKGASETPPGVYYSGERLRLSLKVTQAAYIYVVRYKSTGKADLLFPVEGIDFSNKLEPKRDYLIPPDEPIILEQDTGMKTFFILASRKPESDVQNVVRFIKQEASNTNETYHDRIKHVAERLKDSGFAVRTISFEHRARD